MDLIKTNPLPAQIMTFMDLGDFDTVAVEEVEDCRRAVGATPSEFAEHLGWSSRKYQRVLEAAREADGYVDRDVALAVRGIAHVLLAGGERSTPAMPNPDLMSFGENDGASFLGGRTFPNILENITKSSGVWTAQVTPHLFRLIAGRALRRKLITYGEAATTLEERKLTKRVWPRTLYGMPLGVICYSLMDLGRETNIRIPPLSAIVVKADGEPGPGFDPVIRDFVKLYETGERAREQLARIKRDRQAMIQEIQDEVFNFPHWPGVLRAFGLGRQS
jgi:hypothetical protein